MSDREDVMEEAPGWNVQDFGYLSTHEFVSDVESINHTPCPPESLDHSALHWLPTEAGSLDTNKGQIIPGQLHDLDESYDMPMPDAAWHDIDQASGQMSKIAAHCHIQSFEELPDDQMQGLDEQDFSKTAMRSSNPLSFAYVGAQFPPGALNDEEDVRLQGQVTATTDATFQDSSNHTLNTTDQLYTSDHTHPADSNINIDEPRSSSIYHVLDDGEEDIFEAQSAEDQSHPCPDGETPSYGYQRPSILLSDVYGRITIPSPTELHESLHSKDSITLNTLLEQVCELLHALNSVWLQRLVSSPELYEHCSRFSTRSLLDTGLRVLQRCFQGVLPRTFDDLFALMHVAFAFSLVYRKGGSVAIWDDLSSDLDHWHLALMNAQDISFFARVRNLLWCTHNSTGLLCLANALSYTFSPKPSFTPKALTQSLDHMNSASLIEYGVGPTDLMAMDWDQSGLFLACMRGTVIRECSRFLDLFEYANIIGKHKQDPTSHTRRSPQAPFIGAMQELVMEPLRLYDITQAFKGVLTQVEWFLRDGLFCGVRELEAALISCSRWSQTPRETHDRFLEEVFTRCNDAIQSPDPRWRNGYYPTYLDIMWWLSFQDDQRSLQTSRLSSYAPAINVAMSRYPGAYSNGLPSLFFDANASPTTRSLPPSPFLVLTQSTYFESSNNHLEMHNNPKLPHKLPIDSTACSVAPSDFVSTDSCPSLSSSHPASPASLKPVASITRCPRCPGKVFDGKAESQRRNLRRHEHSEHGIHPMVECPIPECTTTFKPGRTDNLRRHMQQQHQLTLLAVQPTPRKRKPTN